MDKSNDGFLYYLVCIDVFTRKAYGEIMQNKDSISCKVAMTSILNQEGTKPRSILIDNDAGFLSSDGSTGETFSQMLEKKGIALQTNALKDHAAMGIIDNFAKRLKRIITATMLRKGSIRWIDKVDGVLTQYNKTPNSSLGGKSPDEAAKPENYQEILDMNVNKNHDNKTSTDLVANGKVRVNVLKNNANAKGTDPKWSGKVHTVKSTQGKTITLGDDVRHKRHDLLKVPDDAEDIPENIIAKTRKEHTQETKHVRTPS